MSIDFPKLPGPPPLPGFGNGNNGNGNIANAGAGQGRNGGLPGLPELPTSITRHGPDQLPPGIARQLNTNPSPSLPSPPAPGGLPTPGLPGAPSAPSQNPLQGPLAAGSGHQLPSIVPGNGPSNPGLNNALPPGLTTQNNSVPAGAVALAQAGVGRVATANPTPPPTASQAAYTPQTLPQQTQATPQNVAAPRTAPENPAVTSNTPASTSTPNAAPPARTTSDAPPLQNRQDNTAASTRNDPSLLDRLAAMLRLSAPPSTPAAVAPAPAEIAQQTVPLAASASLTAPLAMQGTTNEPRTLAPLAANDRAPPVRSDVPLIPVYTAEGPLRRPMRRRVQVLPGSLTRWLYSMGLGNTQITPHESDPEQQFWIALQWLFWMLAIIAYGCLALAMVAFLFGSTGVVSDGRPTGGGIALGIGLIAAIGAWWLARKMTRQ